jgi:glycyl-tRNA synthetase beta chain
MLEKLKCLKAVRGKTEFESLAQALKRARNILQQAKEKNLRVETAAMDSATLQAAEKSLFEAVQAAQTPLNIALLNGQFAEAFTTLAALKVPVDAFFDGVMVMVEDEALRSQRLGLLALVKELFDRVADFSKLQVAAVAVAS